MPAIGIFSRFIFNNAIFNTDAGEQQQASNPYPYKHRDHDVERRNREYREALKQEKIKQERIIEMRLEAQALKLQERDLELLKDKQSSRQLEALRAQVDTLMYEIQMELVKLHELHTMSVIKRNNLALLVLSMSTPFGMGGSLMM